MRWTLTVILAVTATAQEATRPALTTNDIPAPGSAWYGVYLGRGKVGWIDKYTKRDEDGRIVFGFRGHMEIKADGRSLLMNTHEYLVFDATPPFRLHSGHVQSDEGQAKDSVSVIRTERGYRATIVKAGAQRVADTKLDYTLADHLAGELWLRRGVKVGDKLTHWTFSLTKVLREKETTQILGIRKAVVGGVRQRIYAGRADDGSTFRATDSGMLLSMSDGSLEIRREPEQIARQIDQAHDMLALMAVPVDRPLGDTASIVELVVELHGSGAQYLRSGTRQSVTGKQSNTRTLSIGAAHVTEAKATTAETATSLRATKRHPTEDKRVLALAARAVAQAMRPREKVLALLAFVAAFVEDEHGRDYETAIDVIRSKRGDCDAHAMLFVALARASGVPAREVSGFSYMGDDLQAFGGHAWCEVVLDGRWVEVDPTLNQMQIGSTHISFRGPNGESAFLKAVGRVSVRVISIRRR